MEGLPVATHWQQPKFYRLLSSGLFITLAGLLSAALVLADETNPTPDEQREQLAQSKSTLQPVPTSDYSPLQGSTFYLLSDTSYGSDEPALVRLEANAREQYYLEQYGGADVRLYRIQEPLAFLKKQSNLHRITVPAHYRGEGSANTLSYLWDSWYKSSRRSWQRLLSADSRKSATELAPEFSTSARISAPTRYENPNRFAPIPDLPLVAQFRYPLWQAKGIEPPKGVKLEGSSSEFIAPKPGNVMIPLGPQKPGLYLVEAIIGSHRATTLLFVSNSILITKNAGHQLLAWSVNRHDGAPMPDSQLTWSDGTGILQSQTSDAKGVGLFDHVSPEHSYLLALDHEGGLTIAENFYYDSEIYNTKLYAVTDRPLYRPGDQVNMKFIARHFTNARDSESVADGKLGVEILDPSGINMLQQQTKWQAKQGADLAFKLPDNAQPGGYEIRMTLGNDQYGAAFRVAEYVKPHFDIQLQLDTTTHKTGEAIKGQIQLRYPNGDPVANAAISLSLRAQQLNMVEGELQYAGLFPVKLQQQELKSDAEGNATLDLPAAKEPSRYIMTLLANDAAAWRVKSTREILIERGATPYRLTTNSQFSQPGETVSFDWQAEPTTQVTTTAPDSLPVSYELVRLEDRSRQQGVLVADSSSLDLPLTESGSYTLSLRDGAGNLLAATNHWVSGDGMKTAPGVIEVRFDQPRYQAGDTAQALITFPEPVTEALLTLERDKIEHHALLTRGDNWFTAKQLTPSQWRVSIPVTPELAPNVTFSVLYAKQGEYRFRNAGLLVAQPKVEVQISSDKPSYKPGEKVELELSSQLAGQPAPAQLVVSVVDEMVYLLQPELAPDIHDFFYHPRRNNVRTTSSLNFITYDMSLPYEGKASGERRFNERGVKVLERPRREEKDTALWAPNLQTDAHGKAHLSFTMPDSLTRWRITVRAVTAHGEVGQKLQYVRSEQPFYLKWTGPQQFRRGDEPSVELVAFNNSAQEAKAEVTLSGLAEPQTHAMTLAPGANYLLLPLKDLHNSDLTSQLTIAQQPVDTLQTRLKLQPLSWASERQQQTPLASNIPLTLPADATDLRLSLQSAGDGALRRVLDDLIAYPYGCLEQTASRLIPLAIAYRLADEPHALDQLRSELLTHRVRLIQMANIDGSFGWWGDQTQGTLLLSSYAYFADWFATRALGLSLPAGQGDALLAIYQQKSAQEPVLYRQLALWWMTQMGLPVDTLQQGVDEALLAQLADHPLPTMEPAASEASSAAPEPTTDTPQAAPATDSAQATPVVSAAQPTTSSSAATPSDEAVTKVPAKPVVDDANLVAAQDQPGTDSNLDGWIMSQPQSDPALALSLLLNQQVHRLRKSTFPAPLAAELVRWQPWIQASQHPLLQAFPLLKGATQLPANELESLLARVTPQSPTLERALLLSLLQSQLTTTATSASTVKPEGPWLKTRLPSGATEWHWQGGDLPHTVRFKGNLPENSQLLIRYQSSEQQGARLPVTLQRTLYRLEPMDDGSGFHAVAVSRDETLQSNALYVDELVLTPPQDSNYHFGLLEVPLPPGASVEPSTWGIAVAGLDGNETPVSFGRAQFEEGSLSYRVPIPELNAPLTVRQLLRFAERGAFQLPAGRYFRMYQPAEKALTDDGNPSQWRVE
jgi:alpha-2-macroglobulin